MPGGNPKCTPMFDHIDTVAAHPAHPSVGPGAPLVIVAKDCDQKARAARTLSVWASKNTAAKLLFDMNEKDGRRVSHCGMVPFGDVVALHADPASGRVKFTGLQTCSSVWWCPVCSARICAGRRQEMCDLLAASRAEGIVPLMLTLTFRHKFGDDLAAMLSSLKSAWHRLRQRREWRALAVVGIVTALEVTYGANGWHPHQHVLVLMEGAAVDAQAKLAALIGPWLTSLAAFGLTGNDAALQVQDASAAGEYFGKFGAAEELTLGQAKRGRAGGRTPWQLLDDARDGDHRAARLWSVFAAAFKGRQQLRWSKGLKARFGIGEVADQDVPEGQASAEIPVVRVWLAMGSAWRLARRRRCALLEAARSGGSLDEAEFGLTDSERWRADGDGVVFETDG